MATCNVTGVFRDRRGNLWPNQELIIRNASGIIGAGSAALVPASFATSTDENGEVDFDLEPGSYQISAEWSGPWGAESDRFALSVPSDQASIDIANYIDQQDAPLTPALVAEAVAAKDEAVSAAATVGTNYWPTRAEFVTWRASNTPEHGRVYTAGGVQYVGSTGATEIADLGGLMPFGQADLRHWGAVAGGESTAAIQAALNSGRRRIYVPDGTFLVSSPLSGASNIEIYGPGTLKATAALATGGSGVGQTIIDFNGKSDFTIRGVHFDMSGVSSIVASHSCLNFRGCAGHVVQGCRFTHSGAAVRSIGSERYKILDNLCMFASFDGAFYGDAVIDNWDGATVGVISRNIIIGGGVAEAGIIVTGQADTYTPSGCSRHVITSNLISGVSDVGINYHGRNGVNDDLVISDNLVENVTAFHGIMVSDCRNGSVTGNTLKNIAQVGIYLLSETASPSNGSTGAIDISVVGNAISGANQSDTANIGAITLEFAGTTRCLVAVNVISGDHHIYGIKLAGGVGGNTIGENQISGAAMTARVQDNSGTRTNRIASGEYAATATAVANCSSPSCVIQYSVNGDVVTGSFYTQITASAAGLCTWRVSLPVLSNFTSNTDARGVGANEYSNQMIVRADTTNDELEMRANALGAGMIIFYGTFSYSLK
ncbi:hypothetical protein N0B44_15545 [Roseibacterium beibuensis]|uniref:Pectate lyase superfamily protein domain-containing protein n=1 Tax=[Roseibacterium] beibuensis TaxID=1193142 RepID=A0ABP9L8R5_9RHOB|nr:right-handed parallel beta-helix repeat-containing protein [Roseibacterium beibuensis]MCS6624333.1 hypothetical protein [Roseibacterium beibuensis]